MGDSVQTIGVPVGIGQLDASLQTIGIVGAINSATAVPRIESMAQREEENVGDLVGKIYNSTGSVITLVSVQYSTVSIDGPWVSATILSDDDNYSFPPIGTAAGTAFNIPFWIAAEFSGNLWMRVEISY